MSATVSELPAVRGAPSVRVQALPTWPLTVLFGGFPVLWALGLGAFAAPVMSVPMLAALALRSQVRVPRYFGVWLLFLLWMLMAATQLDTAGRFIGFGFRLANYLAATVIFVYVYNSSRQALPIRRVAVLAVVFLVWVVVGGYLGVFLPGGSIGTPVAKLLPAVIAQNDYVRELVHPRFAEIQHPWGSPRVFERPSAPFAYTNAWGSHYALLLPFVFLLLSATRTRWTRFVLVGLLLASLVPAFATLNRGMFLAVIAGVVYAALRFAGRGQIRWPAAVLALLVVGGVAAYASGLGDGISTRTEYSTTNVGRMGIYTEAFVRTLHAPILGYGAPRPSERLTVSVGTQGQFWNIMFSFGFPALALFCGWLWMMAWRTRRAPSVPTLWLHVVLVMAGFMVFYYGLDGTQLVVIFVAAALALREALPEGQP